VQETKRLTAAMQT